MSAEARRARRPPPRRPARGRRLVWALLAAAVLFALGVALGQALEENEVGDETTTYSRTVLVRPVPETVTVTVTSP